MLLRDFIDFFDHFPYLVYPHVSLAHHSIFPQIISLSLYIEETISSRYFHYVHSFSNRPQSTNCILTTSVFFSQTQPYFLIFFHHLLIRVPSLKKPMLLDIFPFSFPPPLLGSMVDSKKKFTFVIFFNLNSIALPFIYTTLFEKTQSRYVSLIR